MKKLLLCFCLLFPFVGFAQTSDAQHVEAADSTLLVDVPNVLLQGEQEFDFGLSNTKAGIMQVHKWVYNRWGELIFESEQLNEKWDGSHNNVPCKEGAYVWKIEVTEVTGKVTEYTGHINVLQ